MCHAPHPACVTQRTPPPITDHNDLHDDLQGFRDADDPMDDPHRVRGGAPPAQIAASLGKAAPDAGKAAPMILLRAEMLLL